MMPWPDRYEAVKNMTEEQQQAMPINARLRRARSHLEEDHGPDPMDYGNHVLGWHRKHHPDCDFDFWA